MGIGHRSLLLLGFFSSSARNCKVLIKEGAHGLCRGSKKAQDPVQRIEGHRQAEVVGGKV